MKTINFGGKEFNDQDLYSILGRIYACTLNADSGFLLFKQFYTGESYFLASEKAGGARVISEKDVPSAKFEPEKGKIYQFSNDFDFKPAIINFFSVVDADWYMTLDGDIYPYCRPVPEELRVFGE